MNGPTAKQRAALHAYRKAQARIRKLERMRREFIGLGAVDRAELLSDFATIDRNLKETTP